jgi:hypothetical protein
VHCFNGEAGTLTTLCWNFSVQLKQIRSSDSHRFARSSAGDHLAKVLAKAYERYAGAAPVVYSFKPVTNTVDRKDSGRPVSRSYCISAVAVQIWNRPSHHAAEVVVYAPLHESIILAR